MSLVDNSSDLKYSYPSESNYKAFVGIRDYNVKEGRTITNIQETNLYLPITIAMLYKEQLSKIFFCQRNESDSRIINVWDYINLADYQWHSLQYIYEPIIVFTCQLDLTNQRQWESCEISYNPNNIAQNLMNYNVRLTFLERESLSTSHRIKYFINPTWNDLEPYFTNSGYIMMENPLPDLNKCTMCIEQFGDNYEIYMEYRIFRQFRDKLIHYGSSTPIWFKFLQEYYDPCNNERYINITVWGERNEIEFHRCDVYEKMINNYLSAGTTKDIKLYKGNIKWKDLYKYLNTNDYMERHEMKIPEIIDNTGGSDPTIEPFEKSERKGLFGRLCEMFN